jgi:hypothetical protein
MRSIILHVGVHKTGTSSIQQNFSSFNSAELKNKGYIYPIFSNGNTNLINHSAVFYSLFTEKPINYHLNIRWGFDSQAKVEDLHRYYKKQLTDLFSSGSETVIISGEDISSLSMPALQSLKSYLTTECAVDKIKIICATREHSSYLSSAFQEQVKNGSYNEKILPLLSKKISTMYEDTLNKFEVIFGRSNLSLYKFEDTINNEKGIFHYFIKQFLPTVKLSEYKELRTNESLCYEAVELISYINKRHFLLGNNLNIYDFVLLHKLQGSKFQLALSDAQLDKIKEDQNWLRENYDISYQTSPHCDEILDHWSNDLLVQVNNVLPKLNDVIRSLAVEFFRDKAISLENSNLELAQKMMLIAQTYRPNGPLITHKLLIYGDKLKRT